jgi:hypothetical protein
MVLVISVDCSSYRINAVLIERNSGIDTDICTASRLVTSEENSLSVHELEYLAIYWAYEQFESTIGHRSFLVQTDYAPLSSLHFWF